MGVLVLKLELALFLYRCRAANTASRPHKPSCEKGGQWEKALKLFNSIKGRGVKPNAITFNAAIGACEKGGQWERALELFNAMEVRGVKPDVTTHSAAISACEKGGQWVSIMKVSDRPWVLLKRSSSYP